MEYFNESYEQVIELFSNHLSEVHNSKKPINILFMDYYKEKNKSHFTTKCYRN